MNKEQKNKPSLKLWLTIGGVVIALLLAVILILSNRGERANKDWATVIPGETATTPNGEVVPEGTDKGEHQHSEQGNETPEGSQGQTDGTESVTEGTVAQNGNTIPTLGDEDPYEDWLASAMIIGISMQYTDYDFVGIYTASETPVSNHDSSSGAYVIFTAEGQTMALKSVPLPGERGERGTADLYVPAIGYATYESVDPATVPIGSLKERKIEDLEALIIASSQVSIIER